ncbi:DHH family phosphoesterase [Undibacterium arcticum]|uniref:DHH family phosphoesterase n=1 Tax=Undibacterium arcticum TaxID=1762892 RepID=A0ABV7EV15_9BURK
MNRYYAFNGDADGLCALQQLRLNAPHDATLVTGVKRDIQLLRRIDAAAGDQITVLDISLDQNRDDLLRLLASGATVRYFDHHYAGELPQHPGFASHIDGAPEVCTSLLVDRHLGGCHRAWAIVAAFGDSLQQVGHALAQQHGISAQATATLHELGLYLNYNAYGETLADLHFDPVALAAAMLPFADPLEFIRHSPVYRLLAAGYAEDMLAARRLTPEHDVPGAPVMVMPNAPWARRAIGVLANELMQARPQDALAILSPKARDGYTVSVRVPAGHPVGADEFCRSFDTGGGRRLAAGINHLPEADVEDFIARFTTRFGAH